MHVSSLHRLLQKWQKFQDSFTQKYPNNSNLLIGPTIISNPIIFTIPSPQKSIRPWTIRPTSLKESIHRSASTRLRAHSQPRILRNLPFPSPQSFSMPVCGSLINFSRSSPPRPEWLGERRERHHAFSQDLFGPWAGNEANSRGRESLARTSNPINIVATRAAGGFSDSLPPILERIHHSTRLSNNLQRPGPFSRVWKILQ